MFDYRRGKESDFISELWHKPLKILVLTLLLGVYFFFFVWSLVSPFFDRNLSPDVVRSSFLIFVAVAFVVVVVLYSQYSVALCPNCGKKLFFTKVRDYIRCFKCGRFLRIDFERRKVVDPERKE